MKHGAQCFMSCDHSSGEGDSVTTGMLYDVLVLLSVKILMQFCI